jgi:hypothetical protein
VIAPVKIATMIRITEHIRAHLNAYRCSSPISVFTIPTSKRVEATSGLKKCTGCPRTEALAISKGLTPYASPASARIGKTPK